MIAEQNSQELRHTVTQSLPEFFQEQHQIVETGLPGLINPSILEYISLPVLLLHETDSKLWFMDSPKYFADHVKDVYTHPIQDAAHCAPCTQSEGRADSLEGCLNAIIQTRLIVRSQDRYDDETVRNFIGFSLDYYEHAGRPINILKHILAPRLSAFFRCSHLS